MNFIEKNCVFCKKYLSDQKIIDLSDDFFAFQSINKSDQIHYLVCPKKHLDAYFYTNSVEPAENFNDRQLDFLTDRDVKEVQKDLHLKLLSFAQKIITDCALKTARIIINVLKPYASVGHAHMHVIGHKTRATSYKNKKMSWFDSKY